LTQKKPSPAQNAKKATKPGDKPSPKKPAPRKVASPAKKTPKVKATTPKNPATPPVASKWRVASPEPATPSAKAGGNADALQSAPSRALMVIPQPEPLSPWEAFKAGMPESFDGFIGAIAAGGHLAGFVKERGIPYTTMLTWIASNPQRSEMYARAREDRADVLADEIVAISDEVEVVAKMQGQEVVLVLDAAAVSRNKLRVDARKWAASKLKPRTYGDKIEMTGTVNHRAMPDSVLLQRLAAFGISLPAVVVPAKDGPDA